MTFGKQVADILHSGGKLGSWTMMIEKEDWMGRKTAAGFVGASLVFSIVFLSGIWTALAQQQIAVGAIVKTQIACGESASVSEPYDATIALVEVIRGPEALKRLKASSNSNPAPAAGYEYILANIRFEMKARGAPGDKTFELGRALQFSAPLGGFRGISRSDGGLAEAGTETADSLG